MVIYDTQGMKNNQIRRRLHSTLPPGVAPKGGEKSLSSVEKSKYISV